MVFRYLLKLDIKVCLKFPGSSTHGSDFNLRVVFTPSLHDLNVHKKAHEKWG